MPKKRKKRPNKTCAKILQYADSDKGQVYGKVVRSLGGKPPNFRVKILNESEEVASLSGSVDKKSSRVCTDDWVLAEPMYQSNDRKKYIIIAKYTKDQVRILKREGQLQEYTVTDNSENAGFVFTNQDNSTSDKINVDENIDKLLDELDI